MSEGQSAVAEDQAVDLKGMTKPELLSYVEAMQEAQRAARAAGAGDEPMPALCITRGNRRQMVQAMTDLEAAFAKHMAVLERNAICNDGEGDDGRVGADYVHPAVPRMRDIFQGFRDCINEAMHPPMPEPGMEPGLEGGSEDGADA